jgi:hypothetical protein
MTKRSLGSLEDYQAFVSPVAGNCSRLLTEIEMLRPTLDEALRERFHRNRQFLGLHLVMMSLLDQCVIHADGLLEGRGGLDGFKPNEVRASLRVLAHPFLEEQRCAKLLKRLKENPPSRPELVLHIEGHQGSRVRGKRPFFSEERMKVVRDNWAILELKRVTLDAIRNQLSRHVQFKLEPVELTVENTDWKTPEFFVRKKTEIFEFAYRPQFVDVWTLLIEIAPLLSNSIAHLASDGQPWITLLAHHL